jgi:uncharacterized membrane protein HdeD (DUF308 family)
MSTVDPKYIECKSKEKKNTYRIIGAVIIVVFGIIFILAGFVKESFILPMVGMVLLIAGWFLGDSALYSKNNTPIC